MKVYNWCLPKQTFDLGNFTLDGLMHSNSKLYHSTREYQKDFLPWNKLFLKVTKLSHLLKDVDSVDGILINVEDDSLIISDRVQHRMHAFKSLVRVLIGSPSVQKMLKENAGCFKFSKPNEREPLLVSSLTVVSNILNVTAQQRKFVRSVICPQVTQYRIWTGALQELLHGLQSEIDLLKHQSPSKGTRMGQQIVSSCLKVLSESIVPSDPDSLSWMRLAPAGKVVSSPSRQWEDVLEMFNDLINTLQDEKSSLYHVSKIEVMKEEGLSQIRSILLENSIGYKEAQHQESLVGKKLSKTLGHSSRCLFTLVLYYLYGHVRDIEVDLCGGVFRDDAANRDVLCMGRILASSEEKTIWNGVKQLDRALGLLRFVWETAGMKGVLELQGHLWCIGSEEKKLEYRGNVYFLHGISL